MAKRIKRVFPNADEVMHRWSNQSQDSARCSNVFFQGRSIYSYGYHYELGRLVQYRGHTVALINTDGYSHTTAKHIRHADAAASQHIVVSVSGNDLTALDHGADLKDILEASLLEEQGKEIDWVMEELRARKAYRDPRDNSWVLGPRRKGVEEFNRKALALGFKSLALEFDWGEVEFWLVETYLACKAREEARNTPEALARKAAEQGRRALRKREKDAAEIQAWRQGSGPLTEALRDLEPQVIRVTKPEDGDRAEVQTSRGARVGLHDACRLIRAIQAGIAKSGDRVGPYRLDLISGDRVVIGCHEFSLKEAVEALAPYSTNLKLVSSN